MSVYGDDDRSTDLIQNAVPFPTLTSRIRAKAVSCTEQILDDPESDARAIIRAVRVVATMEAMNMNAIKDARVIIQNQILVQNQQRESREESGGVGKRVVIMLPDNGRGSPDGVVWQGQGDDDDA